MASCGSKQQPRFKIVFLNQMAGPLFRELAEDMAEEFGPAVLYTGHPDTISVGGRKGLTIEQAPQYDRTNILTRLFSWFHYFFKALVQIYRYPSDAVLFVVSNPPFLGLSCVLFKKTRQQKYAILVYDIYPDLLIEIGRLNKGLVSRVWDYLNRITYRNADHLITISHDMLTRLEKKIGFDTPTKPTCIPPWVDVEFIKPIPKSRNPFAQKHDLVDKTVILYSGNMGYTHNIESILETAKKLSEEAGIQFVFIGEGAKWMLVQETIDRFGLRNITLLPFQPEDVLPYSIACGDIGVVAYQEGSQGCMMPSKTYYYMAAGLMLIIISDVETDLTSLAQKNECGIWIRSDDTEGMVKAILRVHRNKTILNHYKKSARKTAETDFSRKNSSQFIEVFKKYLIQ